MLILLYVFILTLACYGTSYCKNGFWADYLSKERCNAIKGICILLVFSRHMFPYLLQAGYEVTSFGDRLFYYIDFYIMQLLVVMFLFYSGFGVMESISKNGDSYIASMPRKRFLSTLLNYDVAVVFYFVLALVIGRDMSWQQVLLSFLAWDSVGNSNWYIFVILACYIVVYSVFIFFRVDRKVQMGGAIFLFIIVYLFLYVNKQEWWYNTLFSFPLGMSFSNYKKNIETFLQENYWKSFLSLLVLFLVSYFFPYNYLGIQQSLNACIFAIFIVLISMKFHIGNSILFWLGINLFPLYIYQRIPMVAMASIGNGSFVVMHPWLFIVISACITVAISFLYKYIQIKI